MPYTRKLKEDTVSADRKENIIFDPDAWRKGKSGKKTAAVTSRQNFDNEKFTRNSKKGDDEEVNESAVQNTGSSNIDVGTTPSPVSKTTDQEKEEKAAKSGQSSSQIQFVTGKEQVVDSSKTLGMPAPGGLRKIGEAVLAKVLKNVKVDKNVGTEEIPFDGPYTKPKAEKNSDGTPTSPISKVRQLAKHAMNKQKPIKEEVEGDSNRQINYYQFLKRLKAAGIKVPAAIQVESVSDDELDASDSKRRATKAVKETPKHERDEVANSMQPAKPDAAKIALRKRIEAHHERMRQKAEEGDDPYALK